MQRVNSYHKKLTYSEFHVEVRVLGTDCSILFYGGEAPHIGCTVLSVPRPSIKNPEQISCTSSVINVTGHKDEIICRHLAEAVAKRRGVTTVCTGGFHIDDATEEQIAELMQAVVEIEEKL